MSDKERLNDSEFVVCVVCSFVCFTFFWEWFCETWVRIRNAMGLDLFPEFIMHIYTAEELALAPYVDGVLIYSYIFLWLKLKNYPEWISTKEVFRWQMRRRIGYIVTLLLFLLLWVGYLWDQGRFA